MKKSNNTIIAVIIILIALLLYSTPSLLNVGSITGECGLSVLSIDKIETQSNVPELNYENAYILTVRADQGGECVNLKITDTDLKRFNIPATLNGDLTLTAKVKDMSLDYKVYNDITLYKIYESTGSDDLSRDIPYTMVSLDTTKKSALGLYQDPNNQAPKLSHLGNFPSGGDINLMKDIGKWAYVVPEASNIPFGSDKTGNWWVTHFGGIPYYRGYLIDTMAFNKYAVEFILSRKGELLAKTTLTDQERNGALGDVAYIKSTGGLIESVFPPQPATYYAMIEGAKDTPVEGQYKFVTKRRYDDYANTLEKFVAFDNNYFVHSWAFMSGTLMVNTTPSADIYLNNNYLGFSPVTVDNVPIGRHILTVRKYGYNEASQDINLYPALNKVSITLTKIPPPTITIQADPPSITQGQSAKISWTVTGNFNTIKLFDPTPSTVSTSGSKTVSPQISEIYTITASGEGGESFASIRLSVSPPPPPPPAPPARRDPGVGRESLTMYENNLNNMLGIMATESGSPGNCIFDPASLKVTCRPTFPVNYQTFRILLKASSVSLQLTSGMPRIDSITIPQTIYSGDLNNINLKFTNIGDTPDSFDVYMQSVPSLSEGVQQFTISSKESTNVLIPFSGPAGTFNTRFVVVSKNNPFAKSTKEFNITILQKPLPDLPALKPPDVPDILSPLQTQNTILTLIILILGGFIVYKYYWRKK